MHLRIKSTHPKKEKQKKESLLFLLNIMIKGFRSVLLQYIVLIAVAQENAFSPLLSRWKTNNTGRFLLYRESSGCSVGERREAVLFPHW